MQYALPLLRRFFAKVVLNVLPAAMASVIGGILFTHYQLGGAIAPQTGAEQLAPASAEMMKLVRDEHVLIVDFRWETHARHCRRRTEFRQANIRNVLKYRNIRCGKWLRFFDIPRRGRNHKLCLYAKLRPDSVFF